LTNKAAILGTSIAVHLVLACLALFAIAPTGLALHPILGAISLLFGVGIVGYLNYRSRNRLVDWVWFAGPILSGLALTLVTLIVAYRVTVPSSVLSVNDFVSFIMYLLNDVHELAWLFAAWLAMTLALCAVSLAGAALGRLSRNPQHGGAR